jgi:hypothetical protein
MAYHVLVSASRTRVIQADPVAAMAKQCEKLLKLNPKKTTVKPVIKAQLNQF